MSEHILLTGANGFLGSHILSFLLKHSYSVRAIVRSQSKANQILSDFPHAGSSLDIGIVPDITAPNAFDSVVQSPIPFDAVIHTASPFLYSAISDYLQDLLLPALKGTEEILKSVHRYAPRVKRVVLTSSMAAVLDFDNENERETGNVYMEKDWNPVSWEDAVRRDMATAYRGSKKFAEKAAWDFIEREKPAFDLVTLCPPMIYGPLAHSISSIKDLNQSNKRIYDLFINSTKDAEMPPNGLYLYVDVRDIAHAHILALTLPEASNRRFLISAGQVSSQRIADILRERIPELENRTPIGRPKTERLPEKAYTADSGEARRVLGLGYREVEETFGDLGVDLVEIERRE